MLISAERHCNEILKMVNLSTYLVTNQEVHLAFKSLFPFKWIGKFLNGLLPSIVPKIFKANVFSGIKFNIVLNLLKEYSLDQ